MDYRQLMRAIAAGRILVGISLVALPGVAGSAWIGPVARDRGAKAMTRAMGVRDLALGVGTLRALDRGEPARSWVALGGMSDAVDLAATALAIRTIGVRRALPVMAVAATAAAVSVVSMNEVD